MRRLLVIVTLLTLAPAVRAEVVESSANGFTSKTATEISAVPRSVYLALTAQVGSWWDPQHTWSGNARNMAIDPRAGGCFCEKLANGGSVQHMTVILAEPGKTLRMRGALGPLQEQAIVGTMTWTLTETGSRTRVEMTYVVGGYMRGGLEPVAKIVDTVIGAQVQRLKQYIESGRPS
jgi:activator of Hsp90 ATPase-like protein